MDNQVILMDLRGKQWVIVVWQWDGDDFWKDGHVAHGATFSRKAEAVAAMEAWEGGCPW